MGPTGRERLGRVFGCLEAGTLAPVELVAVAPEPAA